MIFPSSNKCDICDGPTDEPEDAFGEFVCVECLQNKAESAWERHLEDCAGGSGPVSLREQMIEARRLK